MSQVIQKLLIVFRKEWRDALCKKDMDRLLNGVQKSIDRADSIMREVTKRVDKQKKTKPAPCNGCGDSEESDGGGNE